MTYCEGRDSQFKMITSIENLKKKPVSEMTEQEISYLKKNKNKKEKPWDTPDVDKWKIVTITPVCNIFYFLILLLGR